jgi:cobalt-zinc-cadmium efflux system membrane fusion protein
MKRNTLTQSLLILLITGASGAVGWHLLTSEASAETSGYGEAADTEAAEVKGPNGGLLLQDGNFAVEVTIYETDIPPEFRLYAYENGELLAPDNVKATLDLVRLGNQVDRFVFESRGDYLGAEGVVTEPHSFDVNVSANYSGKTYTWSYESHEGRTIIPDDIAARSGIETAVAGSMEISPILSTNGFITADPKKVVRVAPRFTGTVERLMVDPGQLVKAGDELAQVENQQTGVSFSVTAPMDGEVLEIQMRPGERASENSYILIADLSTVWAQLRIYSRDRSSVEKGQTVFISNPDGTQAASGTITYISPVASSASQTQLARVVLDNENGQWLPGFYINASIEISKEEAPLAVLKSGLQTFRDFTVVFAKVDETYEVRMLEFGREDGETIEVVGGLKPGETYVTENSFLLKADVLKSGASHDH